MKHRNTPFRCMPFASGWVAWHESRDPAFHGAHQIRIRVDNPRAWRGFVIHKAVQGRTPFEALERLKRQLSMGSRP